MRYESATEGIRVRVRPRFSLAESAPADGTFVFSYHVSLANEGPVGAQLLFRHWRIHDSAAGDSVVDGEGVIGQQPFLAPGASHEYSSYCVLQSPVGHMEGYYTFVRPDGRQFRVEVPRFELSGPLVLPGTGREAPDEEGDRGRMH
jgi:ApaG protein